MTKALWWKRFTFGDLLAPILQPDPPMATVCGIKGLSAHSRVITPDQSIRSHFLIKAESPDGADVKAMVDL